MLDYLMTKDAEDTRAFDYYVEGNRAMSGEVLIDMLHGSCTITRLAPNDKYSRYANHLANALERYFSAGKLKSAGTVMWY